MSEEFDWDGSVEEHEFARLVEKTELCKVKFDSSYGTFEDGTSQIYWHWGLDGNFFIDKTGPHSRLLDSVLAYLIWSSQTIKELEVKLALAKLSSNNDKTT
jgi:hypothetical protein